MNTIEEFENEILKEANITKEVYSTDEITCPNCGYTFSDSWEYDECGELECEECGCTFDYERFTNTTYDSWISE